MVIIVVRSDCDAHLLRLQSKSNNDHYELAQEFRQALL